MPGLNTPNGPRLFFLRVFKKLNNRIRLEVLGAAPRSVFCSRRLEDSRLEEAHTCHTFLPLWVWKFIVAQFLVLAYLGCLVV